MREAILLLAGGAAVRFPGKLEHPIEGRPMIVRLFERLRASGLPTYVAGKGSFAPEIDAALDAPLLIDRAAPSGPLRALLDACAAIPADRIFAIAGDQPLLEPSLLDGLARAWRPGDEAVVPRHDGGIEPLAALYDRRALLREGAGLRRAGRYAMRDALAVLATRLVRCDLRYFCNVNAPADLAEIP